MLKLIVAILLPCGCAAAESVQAQRAAQITPEVKPFRVTFKAWVGEPAKPQTLVFYVELRDFRTPFCEPTLGDVIPRTKVRLERFEHKMRKTPDGKLKDVSELTLLNTETKEAATLVLGQQQDVRAIIAVRTPR